MDEVECPICNNPFALQLKNIIDCFNCKKVLRANPWNENWEVV